MMIKLRRTSLTHQNFFFETNFLNTFNLKKSVKLSVVIRIKCPVNSISNGKK